MAMTTKEMGAVHGALLGGLALYVHPDKMREVIVETLANQELWDGLRRQHEFALAQGLVNDPEDPEPPDELEGR